MSNNLRFYRIYCVFERFLSNFRLFSNIDDLFEYSYTPIIMCMVRNVRVSVCYIITYTIYICVRTSSGCHNVKRFASKCFLAPFVIQIVWVYPLVYCMLYTYMLTGARRVMCIIYTYYIYKYMYNVGIYVYIEK